MATRHVDTYYPGGWTFVMQELRVEEETKKFDVLERVL